MDVNFPRAVIESVDSDTLFQDMEEYQKNLNSGYNDELNMTAGAFEGLLHAHLEEEHPGLEIPPNSSYFQVMRNTFEELALLIVEMEDMNGKHRRYIWANRQDVQYKMNSAKLTEMRLDFERRHQTMTLKFQKLLDFAMMNASASGGIEEEEEADPFLGILRKGILFVISRSFRGMLRVLWEMGEGWKEMIKRDDERVHAFPGWGNEVGGGGPSKPKRKKKKARKIIAVIGAIDVKL